MYCYVKQIIQTLRVNAGVKLLTHLRTKALYEADMTPELPTENFRSPTNVSKSVTNAS